MSGSMHLIVHASTQHVLAAALTAEGGTPEPDAESLLDGGLLLRNPNTGATEAKVGAEQLSVQTLPAREDVLMTPRRFVLVDGLPELADDGPSITLTLTDITVNLVTAAPKNEIVWLQIEGDKLANPVIHQVDIAETATSGTEPMALPLGAFRVLVLANRHRSVIIDRTLP